MNLPDGELKFDVLEVGSHNVYIAHYIILNI